MREPVSEPACSSLRSEPYFSRSLRVVRWDGNRWKRAAGRIEWTAMSAAVAVMLALSGGCAGGGGKVDGKVAVINLQRLLSETSAGKKVKENLAGFSKNRQALMEMEEKELRRMEEDFVKQSSVLSPAAKREREEQFRRRMQEYQQKASELNREVQEKQKDVLEGFRDKSETVVAKVAKRLGLQVVVDRSKGGPTIYHEEGLDISGQVIEEFNREYP
jgi:outer membrane protein